VRVKQGALSDEVRVISAPIRAGASQARNIGATIATGSLIAFLDDDDAWDAGYLEAIASAVAQRPEAVLFAAALHDSVTREPIPRKNETGPYSRLGMVRRNPGVVGSNLVVDRRRFLDLGGFDPSLPASEDVDLAIRFVAAGHEVVRVSDAVTYYDATHDQSRLSEVGTLMSAKQTFVAKHVSNVPRRWALLADYAARLVVARARS
jgi:GT2 family glycosyltransferase